MPSPSSRDRVPEPEPTLSDFDAALAWSDVARALQDGAAWNAALPRPGAEPILKNPPKRRPKKPRNS